MSEKSAVKQDESIVKVYVTKYAFTKGVFVIDAKLLASDGDRAVYASGQDKYGLFLAPSDYALTPKEAAVQVDAKRRTKLASIAKQKMALDNYEFKIG